MEETNGKNSTSVLHVKLKHIFWNSLLAAVEKKV